MKDWNPQYRFRSISFESAVSATGTSFVIDLESVVHFVSGSAAFRSFPTASGSVVAGFNIGNSVDAEAATNAVIGFTFVGDLATNVFGNQQQMIDLGHMIIPAGTEFQVRASITGGVGLVKTFFSVRSEEPRPSSRSGRRSRAASVW